MAKTKQPAASFMVPYRKRRGLLMGNPVIIVQAGNSVSRSRNSASSWYSLVVVVGVVLGLVVWILIRAGRKRSSKR